MAFDKTLIAPIYLASSAVGYLLKIQASVKTLVAVAGENCKSSSGGFTSRKSAYVWNGNLYIPYGKGTDESSGYVGFLNSPNELAHLLGKNFSSVTIIPMGDRVVSIGSTEVEKGISPFIMDGTPQAKLAGGINDYAIIGDSIVWTQWLYSYSWQYPFTTAPSQLTGAVNYMNSLAEFKGKLYAIAYISTSEIALFELNGVTWSKIGINYNVGGANLNNNVFNYCLFQFNHKLWLVLAQVSTQRIRCFEINEATGVFTEHNSDVPAILKGVPSALISPTFAVIDDTGTNRAVYIFVMYSRIAGWYLYEFKDGSIWTLVNSGTEEFSPPFPHILWDENAKGAEITSAIQNISGHVDCNIDISDLKNNAGVNIKPSYFKTAVATEFPPYSECTEQTGVGSEGKVALASKPSGITTLADLSDDFADSIIDLDLWEKANISIYAAGGNFIRDSGIGNSYETSNYEVNESAGKLLFPVTTVYPANIGIGLKNKWWLSGAFQVDVVLENLANLRVSASDYYALILYVKEKNQKGYGIAVFSRTGPLPKAKPFVFQSNTEPGTKGSDSTVTLINGMKLRISRSGSNVWTLKADPDGANETLVLGANPTYSGPVQIFLFGINMGSLHFSSTNPGPGFGPITVSGAGSLGKYDGAFRHYFAWDVIQDIGGSFSGFVRMLISSS